MKSALHIRTKVLPGHKIEIHSDNLEIGDTVDVFVVVPQNKLKSKTQSITEIIQDLPGQEIFQTPEQVEEYLQQERKSWDY